ncbi:eukaryotic translation initiation factor 3 subunit B-like [Benincasa hispida]|uniref:eukaryotic translation initiation factor 3 subunit B-like n=1 Tax=Benincasa hispida TaxID=102211 RepID=UPI0018FFE420|nr:eukaryotic translation initiation factor 3 subunit B-like [Benincasa hispida]
MADVMLMKEIEGTTGRLVIDLSQVDFDAIRLPPSEDFGIIRSKLYTFKRIVPPEKFEKLEGVVHKIFGQIRVIKDDGLWMPVDPTTQKTLGYCFIEYDTPQFNRVTETCNLILLSSLGGT